MSDQQFVLAYGNPAAGFEFVGPFDSHEGAVDYGEQTRDADWHVVKLVGPIEHLVHETVDDRLTGRLLADPDFARSEVERARDHSRDITRHAAQDDPRGERDR